LPSAQPHDTSLLISRSIIVISVYPLKNDTTDIAGKKMATINRFQNRYEAGQLLASQLSQYANNPNVLVLGLPRGGVPVAFEIAKKLNVSLDICLVRKLGIPGSPEVAMGAIASGGVQVLNDDLIDYFQISREAIAEVAARELQELQRRDRVYRGDRPLPQLRDRTIILVDDGLATGSTMQAAIEVLKPQQPQQIIVAIPVALLNICNKLGAEIDEVLCLKTPSSLGAIGRWYENFDQTTDEEVCKLLVMKV
jgi:putative phosphoribosyl transferase